MCTVQFGVQYLTQGYYEIQMGEVGIGPSNLLSTGQPTLRPELELPIKLLFKKVTPNLWVEKKILHKQLHILWKQFNAVVQEKYIQRALHLCHLLLLAV